MAKSGEYHIPVLLKEILQYLDVKKGSWYLDCTVGNGGHSLAILQKGGNIIGIDQDKEALAKTAERFAKEDIEKERYKLIQGNFSNLEQLVGDQKFAGILMDIGVSSPQLDTGERGFSYAQDAPLDMRMNQEFGVTASDLVNGLHKGELTELFEKYGEVRNPKLVAAIIEQRKITPITTTTQLTQIINKNTGGEKIRGKIHPATTIFQALRIAVNDELNSLRAGLTQAEERLESGASILVISFHSLEDRIVKNQLADWQSNGVGEIITKKPVMASETEIFENPRSRSAKLRVFKKNEYI